MAGAGIAVAPLALLGRRPSERESNVIGLVPADVLVHAIAVEYKAASDVIASSTSYTSCRSHMDTDRFGPLWAQHSKSARSPQAEVKKA